MILRCNENLDDKMKPCENIVLKRNKKAEQAEECSHRYDQSEEKRHTTSDTFEEIILITLRNYSIAYY